MKLYEWLIQIGNVLSVLFCFFSVLNFVIYQKKKDTFNRFIFFLQLFLMLYHLSSFALEEEKLSIPNSVAIFGLFFAFYSLLFAIIFITLLYSSIIQFIFDSHSQQISQRRIEKTYLLAVCISMIVSFYPIFEQQANSKEYITEKNKQNLALFVIIPSSLFVLCVFFMFRARQKRMGYSKEMRQLLINDNMLTEPKIIMIFTCFSIVSLVYQFADEEYNELIANEIKIPFAYMGFVTSIHYILFSGLYKSSCVGKLKSYFSTDGFNDELSLVGDPHADSLNDDFPKK